MAVRAKSAAPGRKREAAAPARRKAAARPKRDPEAMQRRIQLLEGIARGEKAVEEGRTLSHASAKKRMARWLR